MSVLPDELWTRIMEVGIDGKTLDYKNLCCLSITCRRLHRLTADDTLWSSLLLSDYPSSRDDLNLHNQSNSVDIRHTNYASSSTADGKFKRLYKIRYDKDMQRKRLTHMRVVLRIESEIADRLRKIQEIRLHASEEKEKMNDAVSELLNLRRIRQASVALNVWQPEIVRGRQRQMVQQSNVPVHSRINTLEMELILCKQQIAGFDNAIQVEKRRLHAAKAELASVMYHPLQEFSSTNNQQSEGRIGNKKLKHNSTVKGQLSSSAGSAR